jgi:hypothetical protein
MRKTLKEQLEELAKLEDKDIDTSDIPEVTDWSAAQASRRARLGGRHHETRGPKDT